MQESWAAVLAESHVDLLGMRCLLVEDRVIRAGAERLLLVGLGAHVVLAESLEKAHRILTTESFDIAIVEIGLPEGCGSDCVRAALGGMPPPVLFISGDADGAEITQKAPAALAVHSALVDTGPKNAKSVQELREFRRDFIEENCLRE